MNPPNILPGIRYSGFASNFGGPNDKGVKDGEGVALFNEYEVINHPEFFLPPFITSSGTPAGLARRLVVEAAYCACRWDYKVTPKVTLRWTMVRVERVDRPEAVAYVYPIDWGPNIDTGRIIDLSPSVFNLLELKEDETEVYIILQDRATSRWSELEPSL